MYVKILQRSSAAFERRTSVSCLWLQWAYINITRSVLRQFANSMLRSAQPPKLSLQQPISCALHQRGEQGG